MGPDGFHTRLRRFGTRDVVQAVLDVFLMAVLLLALITEQSGVVKTICAAAMVLIVIGWGRRR